MITRVHFRSWFMLTQLLSLHLNFFLYKCNRQTVFVYFYGYLNDITWQRGDMPHVLLCFFTTFVSLMLDFSLLYSITVGKAKQKTVKLFLYTVYVHSLFTNLD